MLARGPASIFVVARAELHAPNQEKALLETAVNLLVPFASDDGEFHGPTINEFFPPAIFFPDTPFEMNRIILIRFIAVAVMMLLFWAGTRRMKIVPTRLQSLVEMGLDLVRVNIAEDLLGKKDGKRFLPLITTIFFMVLFMNLTGVIPFLNIAGTSVIGVPLVLALVAYAAFLYAGIKKHPGKFFRNSLFPPGVPPVLYIIVTPIEFVSTFLIRPVTLTLRLLMNMVVGHLLLVLFFAATQFFFFTADGGFKLFGVGTLAFGFVFTLFELLVATLQAYVFALLTAVYIQLALADEH
ncbi:MULTISPECIES: F0F1 ATP synthase subunit A [Cryobacterium]|jgi:F-type H+-transporting ATPase subunit a|uniref:ATP synthase subunit a n=1 Tax=Cryobacterium arcticum TaxID=670052 RepID=A0A1B1BGR1_9MICO|nr:MULTISPECIES: F0F1 ATP synthase subunit A [Cryobacterium]ANP71791.1 ATP synthase F0F1 subunit A [Cryobacterium arcticum]QYF74036.1 F0F1 ATP synthase subunit A [Cryobacterium sp. PAMC25264]